MPNTTHHQLPPAADDADRDDRGVSVIRDRMTGVSTPQLDQPRVPCSAARQCNPIPAPPSPISQHA
jgi:hypothetical protein